MNYKKIISQERGFLNFLSPLMTAGLPLMKSVLTPLVKGVLIPLGLSAGMSATDACSYSKENLWIRSSFGLNFACSNTNNFKCGSGKKI